MATAADASKREDAIVRNQSGRRIKYKINRRPSQLKKLSRSGQYAAKKVEHAKSSVRVKVEHVFGVVKRQLRFRKTRYRGLEKQRAKFHIVFALQTIIRILSSESTGVLLYIALFAYLRGAALQKLYKKLLSGGRVERVESKKQPKSLNTKTVRNINQVISSAMDFAIDQKLIVTNPTDGCSLPKLEHREMKTLPIGQLASFLHEAKGSGVFEMYYIELATSLRRVSCWGSSGRILTWSVARSRCAARLPGSMARWWRHR